MEQDVMRMRGEVVENLPNTLFRVKIALSASEKILICYLSGKMRKHYIKIMPGDQVTIEVTKYDPDRGRIVYRN